jgi:hypothetical protein
MQLLTIHACISGTEYALSNVCKQWANMAGFRELWLSPAKAFLNESVFMLVIISP